ncbi:MAG TPA: serine hydrolase [Bosea sp. (in: a-proteobacteria)]|uniref:serine hydrolase domain-containing protein n=1 Tax=Bosea sp. (in: a-proteobacteria) TaxID=1871050 RepID=UPI002E10DF08|nr:serine hydrolase [Bosea sp. (in: a-proteobacteria)]
MSHAPLTRRCLCSLAVLPLLDATCFGRESRSASSLGAGTDLAAEHFRTEGLAALIVTRDGRSVASLGDDRLKVDVASVRKSLLGALYGIAISEKRIDPAATLAQLGIDDLPPGLTDAEKRATVRDLLSARSGIYHVAAHETAEIRARRPGRGSHAAGSFWFYNNWDFNALGTIYRRLTGEDIFESFGRRIARPIGMEDFVPGDGRYVRVPQSLHEAYPFKLTARDALRFGRLVLDRGAWNGRQVIPAEWIDQSLSEQAATDRGDLGYGYLWWTLPRARFGAGAGFAAGFGGQFIAVVPARRLVVVQTAPHPRARTGHTRRFVRFLDALGHA